MAITFGNGLYIYILGGESVVKKGKNNPESGAVRSLHMSLEPEVIVDLSQNPTTHGFFF